MKRILITGHKGTIGQILMRGLKDDYLLMGADLPEFDLVEPGVVARCLDSKPDVIIHLAWDVASENFRNGKYEPRNSQMFSNIYQQATEHGVQRVVLASSIHADIGALRATWDSPLPDSPYGANKVFMEALGRFYANNGLEVTCIRFGGVNASDTIDPTETSYANIWLSHRDCCNLVRCCMEAEHVQGKFAVVTAVSNNPGRYHDISNPFGWMPIDSSADRETFVQARLRGGIGFSRFPNKEYRILNTEVG